MGAGQGLGRAPRLLLLATGALYVAAVALLFLGLRGRGQLVYDLSGVVDVEAASPASRAGLETGDRVVGIGDRPIGHFDDIKPALAHAGPGDVVVAVDQRGERRSLVVHREARQRLGVRPPAVRRELPLGATVERCLGEPFVIWWRAWKRRDLPLQMAPDADGFVSFAEFLRPRGPADHVVSAGMVSSYALPLPAALALALLTWAGWRRRREAVAPLA